MSLPAPSVSIQSTPGRLPRFWDRSAVFFANLLGLFFDNEEEVDALAREVGEVDSYGGRLIPIIDLLFEGGENLLVLERDPDPALCDYFTERLGLSLPSLKILKHSDYRALEDNFRNGEMAIIERLLGPVPGSATDWIDGYVTDQTLLSIADHFGLQTIASHEGSHRGNNKLLLHEYLEKQGLPVVQTALVDGPHDIARAASELRRAGFDSAVLKAQIGASGIGMLKFPDLGASPENFPVPPAYFFHHTPCMLQGWLTPGKLGVTGIRSPSVQIFADRDRICLFDITDQILSGDSIHQGNVSPPPWAESDPALKEELLRQAAVAGEWLHAQGYRGTASADFLVVDREGAAHPEVYVCEVNARVTGATYPSVLARHFLPRGAWLLRNLRLREPMEGDELLKLLAAPRHLFRAGRPAGILPVNFNFGPDDRIHKGQFLCLADTPANCFEILRLAEEDLPVVWDSDRD